MRAGLTDFHLVNDAQIAAAQQLLASHAQTLARRSWSRPWAQQPSGVFGANAAWNILAAICHNLLRAVGTLTGTARHAVARGATLRTHLINVPARLARPQRRPLLHLPKHWSRADAWSTLWRATFVT